MAKLELTQNVLTADCFSDLSRNEMMNLLRIINKKYFRIAGYSRVRAVGQTGYVLGDFKPQVNGRTFLHVQYALSGRIIAFLFIIHRHLGVDPIHDIIKVLELRWSDVISGAHARAIYEPETLIFASSPVMKSGNAFSGDHPSMEVQGDEIARGADLSTSRGLHGDLGLLAQLTGQVIVDPNAPIVASINLALSAREGNNFTQVFQQHLDDVLSHAL